LDIDHLPEGKWKRLDKNKKPDGKLRVGGHIFEDKAHVMDAIHDSKDQSRVEAGWESVTSRWHCPNRCRIGAAQPRFIAFAGQVAKI
jgi:hypothetical protein